MRPSWPTQLARPATRFARTDAIGREWDASLQSPLYRTLYPPLDLTRSVTATSFPAVVSDPSILKLGVVARLSEEKGRSTMLRAMPTILPSLPDTMLFIPGDGNTRTQLEACSPEVVLVLRGLAVPVEPLHESTDDLARVAPTR